MKIALMDKKAVGAFLNRESFEGRVLISSGSELKATWGTKPLIAKWGTEGIIKATSEDKGVKKALELLEEAQKKS